MLRSIVLLLMVNFSMPAWAQIVINVGGDIGFNRDMVPARPNDTIHKGKRHSWEDMTENLGDIFTDGLNFANFEAVVSDRELTPEEKTWKFVSHPNSVEHLMDVGFNLLSVANNHSFDYGLEGLQETYEHMTYLSRKNPEMNWHGVGTYSDVARPREFMRDGVKYAFSAVGIFGSSKFNSKKDRVGSFNYRRDGHFDAIIKGLKKSDAQFKILSIHQGKEGRVRISKEEIAKFRRAVDEAGVNFVIGHHPHVVRPVEVYKGSLIAYSLGNLLLVGASNIDDRRMGKNYGLVLKTGFKWNPKLNKYTPNVIEAVPLKGVHMRPYMVGPQETAKYIDNLNSLNRKTFGKNSVQFEYYKGAGNAFYLPPL